MVGKLGVLCVVAVIAGLAFAVPSNRAIEKVKADIDVIVEDVDSRKKGDWGKAADAILSLSDATTNEVERFLLSKEAAFRYLKSGNGGKAKSVLTRLSTFAWAANFFRGVTPRDGVVCRESSRIASRNAV